MRSIRLIALALLRLMAVATAPAAAQASNTYPQGECTWYAKQRRPDIGRAQQLLSWQPEVTLREGLQRTLDGAGREALIGSGH